MGEIERYSPMGTVFITETVFGWNNCYHVVLKIVRPKQI